MSRSDRDAPPPAAERPAVIQRADGGGLTAGEQVLKRLLPAAVVSAGVHLLVAVGAFLLTVFMPTAEAAPQKQLLDVAVEDRTDAPVDKNLTEVTETIDEQTGAVTVAEAKLDDVSIQSTAVTPEAAGNPDGDLKVPIDSLLTFGASNPTALTTGADLSGLGAGTAGGGAGGLAVVNQSLGGRSSATRDVMLKTGGGNTASEAAVARGLAWLARMQKKDGTWVFDGSNTELAASTGMGILPFLAAGHTHNKPSKENKYRQTVSDALDALLKIQAGRGNGSFSDNMYAHGIATVAVCEAFGMTGDKAKLLRPCQAAVDFMQGAQGADGSWGYGAGSTGDTSIVGWQVQALHSAKMCKELKVNPRVLERASKFLEKVASKPKILDGEGKVTFAASTPCGFGYNSPGPTPALTSVGLLCRYYLNGWGPNSTGLRDGAKYLLASYKPEASQPFNMYYYYYATQVLHFHEGEEWHTEWNPKMRDMLIDRQLKDAKKPDLDGSWDADSESIGSNCGRMGTTALALLTLEVYYRHLPLYSRGNGPKNDLDGK